MRTQTVEVPLKQWAMEQAERENLKPDAIYRRIHRGTLRPKLRRVNHKIVFVVLGK